MASRDRNANKGASRPPSAPPNAGTKRKEREYEQDAGDETNINVVVRCRGRNDREVRENSGVVVSTTGVKGKTVELCMGPNAISNKTYHFDKVFSPAADQAIIYEDVVAPVLSEMLSGYNCTIFAYGQTGTGKTYTMSGDMTDTLGLLSDAAGIIPRVLYSLFQKLEADGMECSVKCSFIELYNEELRDLLSADDSTKLKIYDDSGKKNHNTIVVQGLEETHIKSAAEGIKRLQEGSHRRQVAATKCNDLSSRGHTVFTVTTYLKRPSPIEGGEDYICSGKLNLVDLAGSENIQRSGAENKRAAEAGLINKSLLTLGRVINALVDKSAHIPYRESKLTRLLQDSLGGRTKTCIIATVSPAKSNLEETISTLDYAFRAKNIRNKPQVNSMISKKTLLKEFTAEIEKLKSELIATRQRNGVYLTNEQFEEITVESESRRILSEEQKARIETMEVSLRSKVQELFSLTNTFTALKRDNESTRTALENTKDVLLQTEIVLADAKQNLEEETTLRKAHEVTEGKLRSIGTELISTVGESVHDLDRLHTKLRRRSDLHRRNEESWSASTFQVLDVSQSVDSRLDQLQIQHKALLEDVSSRIEGFVNEEIRKAVRSRTIVQSCTTELDSKTRHIETQSSGARDQMNNVLEEIKVLREDVKAQVGQGLNGLSDAAARIAGEVISELDQFHTQLHTSYSSLGKDFKQLFDATTTELAAQRKESERLMTELQTANLKQLEASLEASRKLEECLEAEREAAEEERSELMQQISNLIQSSHKRREQRLANTLTNTKSGLVQSAEDFETANDAYRNGMEKWAVNDSALLERVNTSKEELKNKMKRDWTAVEARNSAIQTSTKAVHEETIKIVDAQLSVMSVQMAALDDFVERARQQNDSHCNSHISSVREASIHLGDALKTLDAALSNEAVQSFGTEMQSQANSLSDALKPLAEEVRQPIQTLTSHFTTTSLQNYTPTGETPARKMWSYPKELPRTITGKTPPKPVSTTPPATAKTPSRIRSKSKSPRKLVSPRKMQIKEVYVDTPPTKTSSTGAGTEKATLTIPMGPPATISRTDSTKSLPSSSLKEIDINTIPSTATTAITTTTSTNPNSNSNNNNNNNNNQTISIPITATDAAKLNTKDPNPLSSNPTTMKTRMPQLRSTRSTTSKNVLSMSVGPGTTAPASAVMDDMATREKENVPRHHTIDVKHVSRPATAMGYTSTTVNAGADAGVGAGTAGGSGGANTNAMGRRLRSSPAQ